VQAGLAGMSRMRASPAMALRLLLDHGELIMPFLSFFLSTLPWPVNKTRNSPFATLKILIWKSVRNSNFFPLSMLLVLFLPSCES
jgi:hypothetical protein